MQIQIKKVKDLSNKSNSKKQWSRSSEISESLFNPPAIGYRFHLGAGWSTSVVEKILDNSTFQTTDAVYKWKILNE